MYLSLIIHLSSIGASSSFDKFYNNHRYLNFFIVLVNGLSLLYLSTKLFIYGNLFKQKLIRTDLWNNQEDYGNKIHIVLRINSVLCLCCLCYLLRVALLTCLLYNLLISTNATDNVTTAGILRGLSFVTWTLLTNWIPNIVPVCYMHHNIAINHLIMIVSCIYIYL